MLDLFQIMEGNPACNGIGPVVALIKNGVFPIIQIGIPILLILMGTIDLGKAVLGNDDKAIKQATSQLIKRAIAAVAVFFVAVLVKVIMGWLGDRESDWAKCWDNPNGVAATPDEV